MYNRLYQFLEFNNLIYDLQFGFFKNILTDKTREKIDKGNFSCGICVDFQKVFDTVHHDILIRKLNYYSVRGIANQSFSSYLGNRNQFVSINGHSSDLHFIL